MDPQLQKLLNEPAHKPYFKVLKDSGRIEFLPNGHCFPARLDAVSAFVSGAKYPKLCKRYDTEQLLPQLEASYFVQSKNFPWVSGANWDAMHGVRNDGACAWRPGHVGAPGRC